MSKVFHHKNLEINIGYKFRDRNLLLDAIKKNNKNDQSKNSFERLEFLGDRVLSLIVSDFLLERFPSANEGELSRRLVGLIRRETLATIAKNIVLVAISEKKNVNALADGLEALIGAIFCDGGIKHAKQFIIKFWSKIIDEQYSPPVDAKSKLQEILQAKGKPLPVYHNLGHKGPDHMPTFSVKLEISGERIVFGKGETKRIAEQEAAKIMLKKVKK
ncbi:MAG: ribonuclease III [Rickettsiales bacterium]|jgi:ribonuclease-3|uniref:RNase III domain-containing protein n=1 Tax=marine metagenome TaxID=408172 RepID=A0A382IRF0_9ZZZZ|nr:ribonuclease III [Rickettsiales bacterium]MEC7834584.1 ribonuclease III [Pseudomonadota bacterium]MEC8876868.1 ribonuclease III [Pseudomonadota bacterium]MEE3206560.1 ribonuclease III [Pseudomonadota bacterium]|tara:strand:+ start:640 stop:1290 length:651 start_codon:yes stop_codon:yes gene_type:complete